MKLSLKKFALLAAGLLALGAPGLALAQVTVPIVSGIGSSDAFQDIPNSQSAPTNVYATILQQRSFVLGQNSQHLTAPTLTTSTSICGGSAGTVAGTDTSGQIAEGSTNSTSCVVTFAKAFITAPECFVSIDNVTDSSLKCSASTTALTITSSSANSQKINYLVLGVPGG